MTQEQNLEERATQHNYAMSIKEILIWSGVMFYVAFKPPLEFMGGADSPLSRYIFRPYAKLITQDWVDTEKQYRDFLEHQRYKIANSGNINICKIITWPFTPKYEKYKKDKE